MIIEGMADLVHPNDPALLFEAARENRRLHLRTRRADAFARLVPWAALNTLVTPERIASGHVRALRQAHLIHGEMIISKALPGSPPRVMPGNLQALCRQGMSLVVNAIDGMLPDVAAMNAVVERAFRVPVLSNCYVSFVRDSAFKAHYDDHDVLALQIHGRKRWRCYGQRHRFPVMGRGFPQPADPGPVEWEAVLEPGDVLFVPRGDVHCTEVEGDHSVHLALAIMPPRVGAVTDHLARLCERHEIGRQDLPILAPPGERRAWMAALKERLHQAVDELELDDVLDALDRDRKPLALLTLGLNQMVSPATRVQTALRRRLPLPADGPESVEIEVAGQRIRLSAAELAVLRLLQERDTWRVAELAERLAPLDMAAAVAAVAALARDSLVLLAAD